MTATTIASAAGGHTWSRTGTLARNRDFRLLWIGQMASGLGSSVSVVAMPLLALAITRSVVLAGAVATVSFMAATLSALPAGYVADRYDGRRLMVLCDGVRMAALAAVALSVLLRFSSISLLLVVAVLTSVANMVFSPAISRAVRAIVARQDVPEAVAVSQARAYAAGLIGPSAGGLLFAAGRAIPFVFDAVSFAVSIICTRRLRTGLRPAEPTAGALRFVPAVAEGWNHVRHDAFLLSSTLYSTVMNLAVSMLLFILILSVGDTSGGAVIVGTSLSFTAAAGLLGSVAAPIVHRRFDLRTVLGGVALIRTLLALAAGLTGSTVALAIALASVVLLSPVIGAVMAIARMLLVPEELFGRVTGTSSFIGSVLQPAAPLLAGVLIASLSPQLALLVLAAAFAAVAVFAMAVPGLDVVLPRDDSAGKRSSDPA